MRRWVRTRGETKNYGYEICDVCNFENKICNRCNFAIVSVNFDTFRFRGTPHANPLSQWVVWDARERVPPCAKIEFRYSHVRPLISCNVKKYGPTFGRQRLKK